MSCFTGLRGAPPGDCRANAAGRRLSSTVLQRDVRIGTPSWKLQGHAMVGCVQRPRLAPWGGGGTIFAANTRGRFGSKHGKRRGVEAMSFEEEGALDGGAEGEEGVKESSSGGTSSSEVSAVAYDVKTSFQTHPNR